MVNVLISSFLNVNPSSLCCFLMWIYLYESRRPKSAGSFSIITLCSMLWVQWLMSVWADRREAVDVCMSPAERVLSSVRSLSRSISPSPSMPWASGERSWSSGDWHLWTRAARAQTQSGGSKDPFLGYSSLVRVGLKHLQLWSKSPRLRTRKTKTASLNCIDYRKTGY